MTEQHSTYILAYHPSNGEEFGKLEKAFKKAGFHLLPLKVDIQKEPGDFSRLISQCTSPVILLLSDNLLKSVEGMYQLPGVWSLMRKSGKNVSMISAGRNIDPESGQLQQIKTDFTRMSGVIRYINWWQDKYLDERAFNSNGASGNAKEERLKAIKAVSTEIGDFLKMIKEDSPLDFEDVIDSNLILYFEKIGHEKFVQEYWHQTAIEAEEEQKIASDPAEENILIESESDKPVVSNTNPVEPIGMHVANETTDLLVKAREIKNREGLANALSFLQPYYNNPDYKEKVGFLFLLYATKSGADKAEILRELESYLGKYHEDGKAHYLAGELHEKNRHFEAALHHYKSAREADKNLLLIDYRLAITYLKMDGGNLKKAKKYLKKSLKRHPEHLDSMYLLGELYAREGSLKKARNCFEKVLQLDPIHHFAHYDLALIEFELKNFEKARHHYHLSCGLNPEFKTKENDKAFGMSVPSETSIEKTGLESEEEEIPEVPEAIDVKPEMNSKNKKIVLITGATSGIGRATAYKFAQHGYNLILTGRRMDRLESIGFLIKAEFNIPVLLLNFDVRDLEATQQALDSLSDDWKNIDILVNNAGLAKGLAPIHEGSFEHWETMIDTNIKGLLYMTRLITPGMVERKTGHIINVCSTAGKEVYPNGNVYCGTKHAVDALTKAMRLDLVHYNIKVGQVSPGHVEETEFAKVRFDGDEEKAKIYNEFIPLSSKDVAEAIFFMATRPAHVNIQDILLMGTQQASSNLIVKSGRDVFKD
jgi:NADP-dependent 3-hydroxy acid dehydrogenase YdfG/TolA-binding protein